MRKELKERAIRLRLKKHLSYSAILKQVPVAKSTLSSWLKYFPLSEKRILELRRKSWTKGEAARERFRSTMRKKREYRFEVVYNSYLKSMANISRDTFFIAGLVLYLAEGSKTDYYRIALANTDPKIISFFVKWLDEFMSISKEKLKAQLHLYKNMDTKEEKSFWKNKLCFTDNQFYKPYISKSTQSSFTYKESFRHGTCSIYYGCSKKKQELMAAINAFMDSYLKRV